MANKKLLIIGHGRHGKDTVGEILRDRYGYAFTSSSFFCAQFVFKMGRDCAIPYNSVQECFDNRHKHRDEWGDLIAEYNTPDKSRTATEMIQQGYDMYVGMRREDELLACMNKDLFDHIIWVDRSEHLPPEPITSMNLTPLHADIFLDNNGTLADLDVEVAAVMEYINADD